MYTGNGICRFGMVTLLLLLVQCSIGIAAMGNTNSSGMVSVSGISSGGFMAVQFHVSHSSVVRGAGIIAGGPFYCANGDVSIATTSCMTQPELISISELIATTDYAAVLLSIDATSNLESSRVWMFSGTADTIVVQGVVEKLEEYYQHYVNNDNIKTMFNVSAEHSFITNSFGNNCTYLGPDYINNCGISGAWEILSHIYGDLNPPNSTFDPINLYQIDQTSFIPTGYTTVTAGLYSYAYAYIPVYCQQNMNGCSYHIVFHGCEQTIPLIGNTFYMNTGYNEIADTNNIIILYPQALATDLNPKGCFDWWGFTGEDYSTQLGVQIITTKSMLDYLILKHSN